jgi:hypothetical protein
LVHETKYKWLILIDNICTHLLWDS